MSEPQYIVLPVQGQNGQPLQLNGAVNVSGTGQLQDQLAQSEVSNKATEGRRLLTWKHSPISLDSLKATLLIKQSLKQSSVITNQQSRKRTKKVRHVYTVNSCFRDMG